MSISENRQQKIQREPMLSCKEFAQISEGKEIHDLPQAVCDFYEGLIARGELIRRVDEPIQRIDMYEHMRQCNVRMLGQLEDDTELLFDFCPGCGRPVIGPPIERDEA